jgi:hypothetical protein
MHSTTASFAVGAHWSKPRYQGLLAVVSEVVTPFPSPPHAHDDAVAAYAALQFDEHETLRRDLFRRIDDDAAHEQIALSDIGADQPAFFTPAMLAWYADHVGFLRSQALERVRAAFEGDRPSGGGPCCLIEGERQRIEDRYIEECRSARGLIRQRRGSEQEKMDELDREIAQYGNEYATLRDGLGREPTIPNPLLYWGLMFLVGIAESFINFDAFRSLSWATPFYHRPDNLDRRYDRRRRAHSRGLLEAVPELF